MKRDCDPKGKELIPYKWEVISCSGESDDETETLHNTKEEALIEYEKRLVTCLAIPCSDVRLYVKDKQGYCNCIKSCMHCANGQKNFTDRMNEL